jgi:hypothetical protein
MEIGFSNADWLLSMGQRRLVPDYGDGLQLRRLALVRWHHETAHSGMRASSAPPGLLFLLHSAKGDYLLIMEIGDWLQ